MKATPICRPNSARRVSEQDDRNTLGLLLCGLMSTLRAWMWNSCFNTLGLLFNSGSATLPGDTDIQNKFQLQETLEAHLPLPKLWFMDPLLRERSLVVLHPPLTRPSSFTGTFQWPALPPRLVQDHSGGDYSFRYSIHQPPPPHHHHHHHSTPSPLMTHYSGSHCYPYYCKLLFWWRPCCFWYILCTHLHPLTTHHSGLHYQPNSCMVILVVTV